MAETLGRVHNAKERADMKTAMDDGVTRVFEQYEIKHKIQKFQDDLLEHQASFLTRGVAMSAQQIHAERAHLGL